MSKKKKHHSAPRSVGRGNARTEQIANYTSKQKKLNPTARNLLLCNLVFLVVCQMCYDRGLISETFSMFSSILGLILIFVSLWIQFKGGDKGDGGSTGGIPGR